MDRVAGVGEIVEEREAFLPAVDHVLAVPKELPRPLRGDHGGRAEHPRCPGDFVYSTYAEDHLGRAVENGDQSVRPEAHRERKGRGNSRESQHLRTVRRAQPLREAGAICSGGGADYCIRWERTMYSPSQSMLNMLHG